MPSSTRPGGRRASIENPALVVLHELGHVVCLRHAEGKDELMYRSNDGSVPIFGDGDRAGLALLGAGRCVPEYEVLPLFPHGAVGSIMEYRGTRWTNPHAGSP